MSSSNSYRNRSLLSSDLALLIYAAAFNFLLHLIFINRYDWFRDEFYYIACGEHLSFGYVDHPPFIALVAAFARLLLGDSLFAIRFFAVLTGSLVVLLTGLTARQLGAGRYGQILAAVAIMVAPVGLFLGHALTMNVFDIFFWILGAYLLVRLIKTRNPRYWIWLGAVMGLGLQNKHSMLFFGFGLVVGLLLTPLRQQLRTRWPWLAAAIALLIFLPNILWEIHYGWPTLEFIRNAQTYKMSVLSPQQFLAEHALEIHPLGVIVLLLGLFFLFFTRQGAPFRVLGWIYLAVLALMLVQHGKPYYQFPATPMVLAAGAVQIEKLFSRRSFAWVKITALVLLLAGGALTAPLTLAILPEASLVRYLKFLHVEIATGERHDQGSLPQYFADMHGWEEMVAGIAKAYDSLSPEEKARCTIWTDNYGEAGAVDFLGRKYGLPKARCAHNSYYYWSLNEAPQAGGVVIEMDPDEEYNDLARHYESLDRAGMVYHPYAMPYENNQTIFIGRGLKLSIAAALAMDRHFE